MSNQSTNNKSKYFKGSFCQLRPKYVNEYFNFATGKNAKVGVIDSGWDYSLSDTRIKKGIGLVDPNDELSLKVTDNFNDENGHGTSCTDLILRIAPDAEIYPVKVFGKRIETSVNILIEAINWSLDNNLKVLNFSLGTILSEALEPLYKACELARREGLIIISANSNIKDQFSYPAIFENAIGVELGNINDLFGYDYRSDEAVECVAKGSFDDVCSLDARRISSSGNSFAAPVIAGIVSLIIQNYPNYNLDNIRYLLHKFAALQFVLS